VGQRRRSGRGAARGDEEKWGGGRRRDIEGRMRRYITNAPLGAAGCRKGDGRPSGPRPGRRSVEVVQGRLGLALASLVVTPPTSLIGIGRASAMPVESLDMYEVLGVPRRGPSVSGRGDDADERAALAVLPSKLLPRAPFTSYSSIHLPFFSSQVRKQPGDQESASEPAGNARRVSRSF